jgi:hypothetical protein
MLWSGLIRNVTLGEKSMGSLSGPIKSFSEVVSNMKKAYKFLFVAPDYYLKTKDVDKKEINNLQYDLYGLYSFRNGEKFQINLKNFKTNNIISSWNIDVNYLSQQYNVGQNDRLFPPKLLANREIIIACDEKPGLLRLDSLSKVVWFNNDYIFHHGMNFDDEARIWTPGVEHKEGIIVPNTLLIDGTKVDYRDDLIISVDSKTGKTLYTKSLTSIFKENKLEALLNRASLVTDPFHLNDVQPVLFEGSPYFNKGDLFLSFRHLSAVIQFRPNTNKVVRVIEGPFTFQHDVDIISNNSIAILNNNTVNSDNNMNKFEFKPINNVIQRKINNSNVLIYNFEENTFEALYEKAFVKNNIYTEAEGLYEILPNGDLFFEEQGPGILWVLNENGVVLKTTLKSDIKGFHYLPNWTSTYMNINF